MPLSRNTITDLVFWQQQNQRRFTQDSPIYPEVWFEYATIAPDDRVELLLTPHRRYTAAELLVALRERLHAAVAAASLPMEAWQKTPAADTAGGSSALSWRLANAGDTVAATLTFRELIRVALPLTGWWARYLWSEKQGTATDQPWFREIVGAIAWSQGEVRKGVTTAQDLPDVPVLEATFNQTIAGVDKNPDPPYYLWSVSYNRPATICLTDSVQTVKADAGRKLFSIDCSNITWAIMDTGIDARHQAFRQVDREGVPFPEMMGPRGRRGAKNHTRIVATYDFTKLRNIMANVEGQVLGGAEWELREELLAAIAGGQEDDRPLTKKEKLDLIRDLKRALEKGRMLDWSILGPLLRVPHNQQDYTPPEHPHGTHVAGILGADMRPWPPPPNDPPLVGICPEINLYDLRVLDSQGRGDEFSILAALQFVRWLNKQKDQLIIQGVNLSLSLEHDVTNFACGRTPICEECQRLVAEGTVVVAAAGNQGQALYETNQGPLAGFRSISITDPGNAEAVITVGATHKSKPHTYGVSYFSSRGPTGDGRIKPDLLAPGEKIKSTVLEQGIERKDGTSMAAPHVSGVAALLLARHREFIGQPGRVKEILCATATDLGRERYFQGHGVVDALRALQSV